MERADMKPAMKAFFLSSLQKRLRMQSMALYKAFKNAAKSENLTVSRFALTFTL